MGKALGEFQDQVKRRTMVGLLRRTPDRKWTYTSAATAREEEGFLKMEEYIRRRQNMVAY